ncbi:hypothetical protein BpHYR1_002988 [Brachionus plicatilis]|uniref:Uncharacterized protein n=1 Tax=Brachionus plicatilis TaxID=10195 RepID=A0A3M7RU94_BRAPC|nr:hypothetical protein BpHYR1_002988 [Brachionus plicatilis]
MDFLKKEKKLHILKKKLELIKCMDPNLFAIIDKNSSNSILPFLFVSTSLILKNKKIQLEFSLK